MLTGRMTRERIESLPDDDWRKHDERFREPRRRSSRAAPCGPAAVLPCCGHTTYVDAFVWHVAS
jgi:hypothetical protein